MSKSIFLPATDGVDIFLRIWEIEQPIGHVQIVHGMNEHSERYDEFAQFLNDWGYNVYATDHRGHGQTIKEPERVGYIGENGFTLMVSDEKMVFDFIEKKFEKKIPHFILGHSMGSFVTQRYIQLYSHEVAGCILMGSCGYNSFVKPGKVIATIFERFTKDERSPMLDSLIFKSYSKKTSKVTPFDWLASDKKVIEAFMRDPYCAKIFPPSFFRQFFQWLQDIFKKEEVAKIYKKMPLMLVAGLQDPVGLYGRGMLSLQIQYKNLGMEDLEMILYEESRHEILNDIEKKEVFQDILEWLEERTGLNS